MGLACIGLYGLIGYYVVQRTSEIGIRMALGAQRSQVLWSTLRRALPWTAGGVALGIPLAISVSRAAESLLFGLSATDAVTLAGAGIAMLAFGLLAAYIPAHRAARIDPLVALKIRLRKNDMTGLVHDVRDGFRSLLKNPGFAAVAMLTLALGIGMTTAIFSVVDAVLIRPVPVADMDRLVMVWETDRASGTTHEPASLPDLLDFKERSRRVGEFAAFIAGEANLNPDTSDPSRVATLNVTDRFLPMLGVTPTLGRVFTAEEDMPGGGSVVLISEALWQRQFQRDPGIIGRSVRFNDRPRTIVGVVPASADFGILQVLRAADYGRGYAQRDARTTVDAFAPLQGDPKRLPRSTHPLFVIGRLAPGASIEAAQQEMTAIAADLERTYPNDNEARGAFVQPLREIVLGPSQPALVVLLCGCRARAFDCVRQRRTSAAGTRRRSCAGHRGPRTRWERASDVWRGSTSSRTPSCCFLRPHLASSSQR